ncbi:MAG: L,D-transpeptidase family protein, partial [Bacteroidota bacterium]
MLIKNVIKTTLLVVFLFQQGMAQESNSGFKAAQLKNTRVKAAYDAKWTALQSDLKAAKISPDDFDIYLRVFKQEKEIQVWMKNKAETGYKLFRTYPICASSGSLGPKRKEGDGQVPEGFYKLDLFNPTSNYHLSLRVSYPNASDVILKTGSSAGGAIMVHGNCVTIGCLPITDEKIKELYVLCVEVQNRKRPLNIDIFPAKLTDANVAEMRQLAGTT